MSAALSAQVLGLCAGAGVLARRGAGSQRRPWLTIKRPESEKTYLEHQLRTLRSVHSGAMRSVLDRRSGDGFYDVLRLRAGSEQFERAYALLYPRDVRCWTLEIAALSGELGLANLWLDHGRWLSSSTALIKPPWRTEELMAWIERLNGHGIRCAPKISSRTGEIEAIGLGVCGTEALIKRIRPHVHRSMRERLWAHKMLGSGHVRPR